MKSIADIIDGLDTFLDDGIDKNDRSSIRYGSVLWDVVHKADMDYPELTIGATGPSICANDMIDAMNKDLGVSSIISFLCILILLVGSFGTWKNPLFSVLSLMSALIWTVGILALSVHTLNMFSTLFGIMLIGLGIDFGIHYITGFIGARENGLTTEESIYDMYHKVGPGVFTGALTTAFVFLSLTLNEVKAMREMGIACSLGIMICYIVMLWCYSLLYKFCFCITRVDNPLGEGVSREEIMSVCMKFF